MLTRPVTASAPRISAADDREMDRSISKARPGPTGISIRNGPVGDAMEIDSKTNGVAKRKSRSSTGQIVSYKDASDSEDDAPLVGSLFLLQRGCRLVTGRTDTYRRNAKNPIKKRRSRVTTSQ